MPNSAKQHLVIGFLYEWLGERQFNRTPDEYLAIARRTPKIDALHAYVNDRLSEMNRTGQKLFDFSCDRVAGDLNRPLLPFPKTVSRETVRKAIIASGLPAFRDMYGKPLN